LFYSLLRPRVLYFLSVRFHVLSDHLLFFLFFPLIIPPPPASTLFPYTTLFRSRVPSISASAPPRGSTPAPGSASSANQVPESNRSEEHTSELQSLRHLVCRLLLEKKKKKNKSEVFCYQK